MATLSKVLFNTQELSFYLQCACTDYHSEYFQDYPHESRHEYRGKIAGRWFDISFMVDKHGSTDDVQFAIYTSGPERKYIAVGQLPQFTLVADAIRRCVEVL